MALREILANFGFTAYTAKLQSINSSVEGVIGTVRGLAAAFVGGAIVNGIRGFAQEFSDAGSAINDASDRLGVLPRQLQELQFAAGQAGVRGEQVNAALSNMSVRLEQ